MGKKNRNKSAQQRSKVYPKMALPPEAVPSGTSDGQVTDTTVQASKHTTETTEQKLREALFAPGDDLGHRREKQGGSSHHVVNIPKVIPLASTDLVELDEIDYYKNIFADLAKNITARLEATQERSIVAL